MNHFANMCRSKPENHKSVHDIDNGTMERECEFPDNINSQAYSIDMVSAHSSHLPDRAFVTISLGPKETPVNFKIDTGSQCNIISIATFRKLALSYPLEPPDSKLTSYSGDLIKVLGKVRLPCSHNSNIILTSFYVVEHNAQPLLGLRSSLDLKLIKLTYSVENSRNEQKFLTKESVMSENKTLFNGIGEIPGFAKLHLKENAIPVVNPPRKVPEALKPRLRHELDHMINDGIIAKVTEPTDWVNSIVLVEKPKTGRLRICLDPKALNQNIRRPHYPMPTLDDVTSRLSGAKFFSILDITHAYWNVKLDEDSSYLTTFNTPFGRYRFLRLPFGIASSQDIFQKKVNETFEDLQGVAAIVDDILVFGRTRQEHDERLRNVLERARNKGVRFNPNKCIIGVKEVIFFGHVITDEGLKADPNKVKAINDLDIPDSPAKLESFLGMVNYLSKFAPNLSEATGPLRDLLKNQNEFVWDEQQTAVFQKLKLLITSTPVLGYFDPKQTLTIECDAAKHGLGACLMQNGRPIAYASKSLTKSEINYAVIEKECLAMLFAFKRFHQYTYGNKVLVRTDHKPLEAIMKKPLSAAPPRLQRMLLQLQIYDIDVHHVRGKEMYISDYLSRHTVNDTCPTLIDGLDLHVHSVKKQLYVTDRRFDLIRQSIREDREMRLLKRVILEGWPSSRAKCDPDIIEYWNHRDELSFEDDLIFRGQTLLIPKSLRQEMVKQVHTGHLGVTKTLQRAKDCLFWPGMQKQITEHVLQCPICLTHRDSNAKEPMVTSEFPDRPYQVLSTDLFHFDSKDYLLTVDHYSRFFEIDYLPDTRSGTVIRKLQTHFARNGICDILHSDNGPQFASSEFSDFVRHWKFKHETSSPLHPQGNCLAERTVGIAKKIMKKAKDCGQNIHIALLEYRNAPLDCGYSPAQLMFSRRTKSVLPITNKALLPQTVNVNKVRQRSKHVQCKQKEIYDRNARQLKPLYIGDPVRVQIGKIWIPGKIVQKHDQRSYTIQTRDGKFYRRNRKVLHKTNENVSDISPLSYNILASSPTEPQSVNSANNPKVSLQNPNSNSPYVTRSGRVVRRNERYYSSDWNNK